MQRLRDTYGLRRYHSIYFSTHLLGRRSDVYSFSVFSLLSGVAGELEVEHAAVLDCIVGDIGVDDEVLQTNTFSPARRF